MSSALEGKRVVVTGVAGFIGSHLSERLLDLGCEVKGIDCFTDYYSPRLKRYNLKGLLERDGFTFSSEDLLSSENTCKNDNRHRNFKYYHPYHHLSRSYNERLLNNI